MQRKGNAQTYFEYDIEGRVIDPTAANAMALPTAKSDAEYSGFVPEPLPERPEPPAPANLLSGLVQSFLRGDSVPYVPVMLTLLWSALIVPRSDPQSRSFQSPSGLKCQWWCSRVSIDSNATTYTGFPLFLLLSFRVHEAFNRYMEAAFIWTVELEQLTMQFLTQVGLAYPRGVFHENDRERIFAFAAAFVETLKRTLRQERDLGDVRYMLSKKDAADILGADDMPDYCISVLNAYLVKAAGKPGSQIPVPGPWHPMVMGLVQQISRCKAKCLRLQNYKVVYGYAAHLHIFIGLWVAILPLALVQNAGWITILWAPLIAYGVVGMEAVAIELSDPFGYQFNDLRLTQITRRLHNQIRECYHRVSDPMPVSTSTPPVDRAPLCDPNSLAIKS